MQCGIIYSPAGQRNHIWVFKLQTAKIYILFAWRFPNFRNFASSMDSVEEFT
jgi:hypothetical protein